MIPPSTGLDKVGVRVSYPTQNRTPTTGEAGNRWSDGYPFGDRKHERTTPLDSNSVRMGVSVYANATVASVT